MYFPGFEKRGASALALWLLAYLSIAIMLQLASGAYATEFANHPDSASHHVTSIMVREYVRTGLFSNPITFAERFYLHYPKVAIGHWPPFFYFCAALWGLVFGVSHSSYLIFMALIAAAAATLLTAILQPHLNLAASFLAGVLFLALPPVREGTQLMMLDTLVALLALAGLYFWIRFLDSAAATDAIFFGFFAGLAILTKGTGVALALLPPLAAIFGRRLSLITRGTFWLPIVPAGLFAIPWLALSIHISRKTWNYKPGISYTILAANRFLGMFIDAAGVVLFALMIYGIFDKIIKPWLRNHVEPFWASLLALLSAVYLFQILTPVTIEQRYLMAAFPAQVAFSAAGLSALLDRASTLLPRPQWKYAAITAAGLAILFTLHGPEQIRNTGFARAAGYVAERYGDLPRVAVLICADPVGEGVVVSELAARYPNPSKFIVLRGSKVLAKSDWVGRGYRQLFQSESEVRNFLESLPVTVILMDTTTQRSPILKHISQVNAVVTDHSATWHSDGDWPSNRYRNIQMYSVDRSSYRQPANISVDMEIMLNRRLQMQD